MEMEAARGTDKKRILVAEDNAALAIVVRFHLERAGFAVVTAADGDEMWERLQAEPFDLVVTDQQMPGATGCEVCQRMRKDPALADLPVVMLTAKGLEMELGWLRDELGVREVLPKPFSLQELVETVENCLAAAPR
jgi:CheY-like chemotaxis protein